MFDIRKTDSERTRRVRAIKDQARASLVLDEDATVMVSELRCAEPGCPPLETVIAVFADGGRKAQVKIHKALDDVTSDDVVRAVAAIVTMGTPHAHE